MNEEKVLSVAIEALIKDIKRTEYAKGFYNGALMVAGVVLCRALKKSNWSLSIKKGKPKETSEEES